MVDWLIFIILGMVIVISVVFPEFFVEFLIPVFLIGVAVCFIVAGITLLI